ncbi:PAS domain S-box protein [Nostoc sp. CCY0012]|uniref:PAS domain S-box protein n=1 Tax=Nostoc sp. CCY0012 TaxID=1056123 RepID=UPI0039C70D6F
MDNPESVYTKALEQERSKANHFQEILNSAIATAIVSFRVYPNYDWKCDYLSPGCEAIFGYTAQEIITNQDLWMLGVYLQDREEIIIPMFADVFAERTVTVEYRFHHTDGSLRWISATYSSRYVEDAQCWIVTGTNFDISERKQIEKSLRQSEARFQHLAANLPGNIYTLVQSPDGCVHFEYINSAVEKIYEVTAEQVLENAMLCLGQMHPDDVQGYNDAVNQSYQNLEPFTHEWRIITPSGKLKWLQGNSMPERRSNGDVAWHGVVQDVSDRKQNEARLEESQQVARLGNWDYDLATGKISWSKGLFDLFHRDLGQLEPTYAENLQLYHPEDAAKLHQAVEKAIATGESYKLILRVVQPDTSYRYFEGIGHAGFNREGLVVRLYGTAQDVTEQYIALRDRQRAEAALAKSEEQLRLTLEFTHIGNWDWNIPTGEVMWNNNHYRLLGLDPQTTAAKYQLWNDAIHPEDQERVTQAVFNALAQHTNYEAEYRVIYPDGTVHWLSGKGRGIYNAAGDPIRMLGVIIDISERKQAEIALQDSETRFQAFMDNSPALAWITDANGCIVYLNHACTATFEILPEDRIGQSIFDIHPPEIAQNHLDNTRIVAETNQVIELIEFAPRPDGSLSEFLVYKFPIPGVSEHKLVGGVAIDITERKILERQLAHKQQLLDAFISSAPVGITVLDQQLRYSLINEALAEINGIPVAEHIGKTPWEIVPDLAPKQEQVFQHILTTGEAVLDAEISGETPKLPGVMRTWLASYFPILSATTQLIGVGIVVLEISDRKRAEQMLELQAVITRNMAEGICLIRASDGIIVYANPKFEQMFGYESGELVDQHVSIVNYEDEHTTAQAAHQAIAAAINQWGEVTYQIHNVKKDGTPFWCRATTSVFGHPEYGNVFVAIQQDITEQKQADEKIKASLKEKEVLLQEIHHRVKNNLGIVSGLLQMQCRRTQDVQATAILRDSQNRIASIALVHEKLYRSEELADIDFAQYIPDLTTHLFDSYNVSSQQIQLNIQVDDASLDIETAIPCGLIINELVSNALKYAFPDHRPGEIQVKFYQESERQLTLIIRDNGIGLPPDFDSKKLNTLGLTLVQGLVKQLRGNLEINCQQGTEFKITFINNRILT